MAQPLMKGGKGLDSPCKLVREPFSKKEVLTGGKPFPIFSTRALLRGFALEINRIGVSRNSPIAIFPNGDMQFE